MSIGSVEDQSRPGQWTEGHRDRAAADFVVDDLVPPADVVRIGPRLAIDDHAQHQIVGAQVLHERRSDKIGIGQGGNAVLGRTTGDNGVVGEALEVEEGALYGAVWARRGG